ncbi:MAG: hypothetical protein ACXAEU_17750 [Candidatus Hodarchaeales archaeon]|jgi:hypothetical protein
MTIKKEFRVSTSLLRDLKRWTYEVDVHAKALINETKNLKSLILTGLISTPTRDKAIAVGRHYEDVVEAISEHIYHLKDINNEIAGCSLIEEDAVKYYEVFDTCLDDLVNTLKNLSNSIPAYLKGITKLPVDSPEVVNQKNQMLSDFDTLGKDNDNFGIKATKIIELLVELKEFTNNLSSKKII